MEKKIVLIALIFCCISLTSCKETSIDLENGFSLTTHFIDVPPGTGTILEAVFLNTDSSNDIPVVMWEKCKTEGVNTRITEPVPQNVKCISVSINQPIYYQGIEISISGGIVRKVEIESKLPGHVKIEIRQQSPRFVALLATGWGEEVNEFLATLWVQTIENENFQFSCTPKWINVLASDSTAWKFPIEVTTSVPLSEIKLKINNINDVKILWIDPGNFFPLGIVEPADKDGNVVVQNIDFNIIADGTLAAPPSKANIFAELEKRGYYLVGNSIFKEGRIVGKINNLNFSDKKKIETWGFYKTR